MPCRPNVGVGSSGLVGVGERSKGAECKVISQGVKEARTRVVFEK